MYRLDYMTLHGATSAKQQRCTRLKARPERLLEHLLVLVTQSLVQKPRWSTVCCLRPFLVGLYSHKAELSNGTSYSRTSFATLLPKKCTIFYIRFISINGTAGQRAWFKLITLCTDSMVKYLASELRNDVTFIAYTSGVILKLSTGETFQ